MLVEWMMKLGQAIFDAIFAICGTLPSLPQSVITILNNFFNILFDATSLLAIFVDLNIVRILIPIVVAIENFDKIYYIVLYVIKKIPILDIR